MHKKIKHIIALSLVIGAISCALPNDHFILGSTAANASTFKNASNGELSSLTISRSTGSEIKLSDNYAGDEVSLSEEKEYYVELTGADGFEISAEVQGSGYVAKVFTSSSKTEKGKNIGDYINVDSTYEDICIRTYKSEQAYEEAYNNEDVTNCNKTYIIHVRKPVAISDEEDDTEHAYLRGIYLSNGSMEFSKNKYSYDVVVSDDVKEINIKVTPDDDDDLVEINDDSVDEDSNYKKTVSLDKGNNTVKIYVKNNDDDATYIINIYRGKLSTVNTSSTQIGTMSENQTFTIQTDTQKFNAWQRVDGRWRYIDGTGEPLKGKWWFDKDTGKNYYLNEDGYMATGWLYNNNKWYYFNESGEMQTGWISLDKNWYYLNKSGEMQMGWLEDSAGNWYYLGSNGAMKTGWVENSDGKWYYLDSTGKLTKDVTN